MRTQWTQYCTVHNPFLHESTHRTPNYPIIDPTFTALTGTGREHPPVYLPAPGTHFEVHFIFSRDCKIVTVSIITLRVWRQTEQCCPVLHQPSQITIYRIFEPSDYLPTVQAYKTRRYQCNVQYFPTPRFEPLCCAAHATNGAAAAAAAAALPVG